MTPIARRFPHEGGETEDGFPEVGGPLGPLAVY